MQLSDLSSRTHIMGIINTTPDSFSGDGVWDNEKTREKALQKARRFIEAKVDIIDVGGESTRPGATTVSEEIELQRVIPVIQAIRQNYSIPISVDTTKAKVAEQAFLAGATILNDVSGLMLDPHMADVVVQFDALTVLMHMKFSSNHLSSMSSTDITDEVVKDIEHLIIHAISRGIQKDKIILDPGIGFGKNTAQNLSIIKDLQRLKALGYPILVGLSRKSFIGQITEAPVDKRLPASIAAATIAIMHGTDIIRVHDVEETIQAAQVIDAIKHA